MSEGKKQYEISFLTRNEGDKEGIIKAIEASGATIVFDGKFSEIKLAYPVKKQTVVYFGFIDFEAEADKVSDLDRAMRFNDKVLRSLIITPPPRKAIPRQERRMGEAVSEGFSEVVPAKGEISPDDQVEEKLTESVEVKEQEEAVKEEVSDELLDQKLDEILK